MVPGAHCSGSFRSAKRGNNEEMKKNADLQPKAVTQLLLEAVAEARQGAVLISQVTGLVSMRDPHLRDIAEGFERIAFQAQLLAARVATEAARNADRGPEFAMAAAEVAALADQCAEAREHVRRLRLAADELEAQRGEKLTRRTSPIRPADNFPSTIS